jgi:hypothetical protein
MSNQLQNKFKPYHFGNGWGTFVDIENYTYDINNKNLLPIIETRIYSNNNEYHDIEKILIKIDDKFKPDNIGYNFEKINNDYSDLIFKADFITFITLSIATCIGFFIF